MRVFTAMLIAATFLAEAGYVWAVMPGVAMYMAAHEILFWAISAVCIALGIALVLWARRHTGRWW